MGPQVVIIGMDMRSQRKKDRIMPPVSDPDPTCRCNHYSSSPWRRTAAPLCMLCCLQATYDLLKRTVDSLPAGPQHLVVLSGIPLIFPKASL